MTCDDVDEDFWYAGAIRWATSIGVAGGYGDGTFRPDEPITREELAAMLYRYERYRNGGVKIDDDRVPAFPDAADVSGWAYDYVVWFAGSGFFEGDETGMLRPADKARRTELAKIFTRYFKLDGAADLSKREEVTAE